jgi:hypothetical protein
VLPILGSAARIVVVVAGVLLLLAATARKLSGRTGDGDPSDREHRYYDPLVGRPPHQRRTDDRY